MLSICDPSKYYGLILTQGIVMGIGNGLLITPTLSIQSQYWDKKLGLALGIVQSGVSPISSQDRYINQFLQSGSSCGGVVMPIMLNRLFKGKSQFAWGTRAVAFLISGLLVIASFLMRTRVPGRKAGANAHKESVAAIKAAALDLPYVSYVVGYVYFNLCFVMIISKVIQDDSILLRSLLSMCVRSSSTGGRVVNTDLASDFYLPIWTRLHGMSDSLAFYTVCLQIPCFEARRTHGSSRSPFSMQDPSSVA